MDQSHFNDSKGISNPKKKKETYKTLNKWMCITHLKQLLLQNGNNKYFIIFVSFFYALFLVIQ